MCFEINSSRKVSPVRDIPPPPPSSPKRLRGDSSKKLRVALDEYRETHPNTLIVDSPVCGLDKRELIMFNPLS
jgi:hypothetical protein